MSFPYRSRSCGVVSRSCSLPSRIDAEKVRADFKDGVLAITLPVKAEADSGRSQLARPPLALNPQELHLVKRHGGESR